MPNEVKFHLFKTVNNNDDCIEGDYDKEILFSHLASFRKVEGQLTLMIHTNEIEIGTYH